MAFFARFFSAKHSNELRDHLKRADSLAREYGHDYIGVEHLFLTLRALPASHPIASILAKLPVDLGRFWATLENSARVNTGRPVPSMLPYTPRLRFVLRSAAKIAKKGASGEVSLMHFVWAVALEHTSLVAWVFRHHLAEPCRKAEFTDAAAQQFTIFMTFPSIASFGAHGDPNMALLPTHTCIKESTGCNPV